MSGKKCPRIDTDLKNNLHRKGFSFLSLKCPTRYSQVTRSGFSNRFGHKDFLKTFAVLDRSGAKPKVTKDARGKPVSAPKQKPLPAVPKDAASVLLARVLGGEEEAFSYPATNKELQALGVQVSWKKK